MDDLAAFIAARYDEAEALAKAAADKDREREKGTYGRGGSQWVAPIRHAWEELGVDPKRRLADIKLKRAILADVARICEVSNDLGSFRLAVRTMRQLGTEFAEHELYKAEWKPEAG